MRFNIGDYAAWMAYGNVPLYGRVMGISYSNGYVYDIIWIDNLKKGFRVLNIHEDYFIPQSWIDAANK